MEDLESRQRRDNCRIIGVEEGFGESRPELAVAKMLQDALALDYSPKLDRAHGRPAKSCSCGSHLP